MKYIPLGSVSKRIELSETRDSPTPRPGAVVSLLTPLDPVRQAKRLPIRVIKMLTAHTGHLLHPEYLQPLTPAPVSIEVFIVFKKKNNNNNNMFIILRGLFSISFLFICTAVFSDFRAARWK